MRTIATSRLLALALWIPLGLLPTGCGQEGGPTIPSLSTEKPETFTDTTNPIELIKLLNGPPVLKADDLASTSDLGQMISVPDDSRPFSSSYWPMTENGILARWQGSGIPSPAEKYGMLFLGRNEQQRMYNWIQKYHGKSVPNVEPWFGICQGWAASAIMERPPRRAIAVRRVNGANGQVSVEECTSGNFSGCMTFSPGDLTALLAEDYSNMDARLIGDRCDTELSRFSYDSAGRVQDPKCRSNAGTLFLLATNFIKQNKRGFVVNATNGNEVWNQPVFAYRLLAYRQVDAQQAARLIDRRRTTYDWNPNATAFRYVVMSLVWAQEASPTVDSPPPLETAGENYQFILELDANGVVIGGEWIGENKRVHPPFFWAPVAPGTQVPYLEHDKLKQLLELSRK